MFHFIRKLYESIYMRVITWLLGHVKSLYIEVFGIPVPPSDWVSKEHIRIKYVSNKEGGTRIVLQACFDDAYEEKTNGG